jgi:hypothetical protein
VFFQAGSMPLLAVVISDSVGAHVPTLAIHYVFLILDPVYGIFGGAYFIYKVCLEFVAVYLLELNFQIYSMNVVKHGLNPDIPIGEFFTFENHVISVILIVSQISVSI